MAEQFSISLVKTARAQGPKRITASVSKPRRSEAAARQLVREAPEDAVFQIAVVDEIEGFDANALNDVRTAIGWCPPITVRPLRQLKEIDAFERERPENSHVARAQAS